ncbi:hypothetical protein RUM43_013717 [Polyplax serrata]|uniref:Uncharacterized protein n=1 Tax=Polyplax serrata TaxID=468196 RepID=A0AAN8NR77_POLSC
MSKAKSFATTRYGVDFLRKKRAPRHIFYHQPPQKIRPGRICLMACHDTLGANVKLNNHQTDYLRSNQRRNDASNNCNRSRQRTTNTHFDSVREEKASGMALEYTSWTSTFVPHMQMTGCKRLESRIPQSRPVIFS